MKISFNSTVKASDNFVIFVSKNNKIYEPEKVPKELSKLVLEIIKNKIIESTEIYDHYYGKENIKNILIVKLKENLITDDFRLIGAKVGKAVQELKSDNLTFLLPDSNEFKEISLYSALSEGVILGTYQYQEYLTDKKSLKTKIEKLEFITNTSYSSQEKTKPNELANGVNLIRDLVNSPPSKLNPSGLEKRARAISKEAKLKITVFQEKDLLKKGMECIANVSFGSKEKSRMIILEYKPKKCRNKKPIVLVGKGITYDSGGINLKASKGGFLEYMKDDMAGSATVLSLVRLASLLKLDLHVISILAVAENLVGSGAYKPGDILKAYNGKTVEIINTDAEGRLVLADAIAYASKNFNPELIIDIATLTGASMIALGYDYTPIIGNNVALIEKIKASSKNTGEKVWELPLDPCYKKYMKGTISDLVNSHDGINAGVITAATFLEEFVGKSIPWSHFDIAGSTMSMRKRADEPGGATGTMMRLLFDFLENY